MANPFMRDLATYGSIVSPDRFTPLANILAQQERAAIAREQLAQREEQFGMSHELAQQQFAVQQQQFDLGLQMQQAQLGESARQFDADIEMRLKTHSLALDQHRENVTARQGREAFEERNLTYTPEMELYERTLERYGPDDNRTRIAEARAFRIPPELMLTDESIPQDDRMRLADIFGTDDSQEFRDGKLILNQGNREQLQELVRQFPGDSGPSSYTPMAQPQSSIEPGIPQQESTSILNMGPDGGAFSPDAADSTPVVAIEPTRDSTPQRPLHPQSENYIDSHIRLNGTEVPTPPIDLETQRVDQDPTMDEWATQLPPEMFAMNPSGDLVLAQSQNLFNIPQAQSLEYVKPVMPGIAGVVHESPVSDTDEKVMGEYRDDMKGVENANRALTMYHTMLEKYGIAGFTESGPGFGAMKEAWETYLTSWRDMANTGALDQGAIDVFDNALGEGWASLNKPVGAILDHIAKTWVGNEEDKIAELQTQALIGLQQTGQNFHDIGRKLKGAERKQHEDILRTNIWGLTRDPNEARKLMDHISNSTRELEASQSMMREELSPNSMELDEGPVTTVSEPLTQENVDYLANTSREFLTGPVGRPMVQRLAASDTDNATIQREVQDILAQVLDVAPEVVLNQDTPRLHAILEAALDEELNSLTGEPD